MTKEDKQIIDRAVKENWRIGDRTRLKHLLEKNLEQYRENKTLEGCLLAEQEHTQMLEKQIEKMKCCQNCKSEDNDYMEKPCCDCNRCLGDIKRKGASDKWEIKENDKRYM